MLASVVYRYGGRGIPWRACNMARLWRGAVILLSGVYSGIYSDMAGGAGRGIIWRGRLTVVNGGAGARF